MKRSTSYAVRTLLVLAALTVQPRAQNSRQPPQQAEDVLRINTELVQTDLMVFDKQGHFVDGLQREQFELTIDGKPQSISFFEQVTAVSSKEQTLLAAVTTNSAPAEKTTPIKEIQGRTIVFFIDDLHLSLDSLGRTRKMLARFIDQEMNDNDRVAIASTSGDIGFLQQFTDNKSVLHAAAGRLTQHPYNVRDMTDVTTPMTEYMALTIERKDDPGVLEFYIDECLRAAYPLKYRRASCEVQVKSRARLILLQAASVTLNTYAGLESLMRSSAQMSGRKLVFFISDGFLLDTGPRNADPRGKLNEITDAALRAGVVIYTIDARGLFSGLPGVTNDVPFDKQNRLESANLREGPASQDALNALAEDTGGRALRNQNYFDKWVNKILDETSNYYLVAWRPNKEEETATTFKNIKVRVIDHPEYTVRLPRGFLKGNPTLASKSTATVQVPAQPHQELQQALTAAHPKHEIPLTLSVVYLDTPEHGPVLTASVRVANEALSYDDVAGKQVAIVDVAGVIINDRAKSAVSFETRLTIDSVTSNRDSDDVSATIYNYRAPLAPGLYQVRIATRDRKSGQVGSIQQWIEIPDLALHRLSLSSLLLGLQNVEQRGPTTGGAGNPQVQFSTDHRFARNSRLGLLIFLYNAARGEGGKSKPDATIEARLLRGTQVLRTMPMRRVSLEKQDPTRLPFGVEMPLDSLPSGQYVIEVIATDQNAKTSASQRAKITLE